MRADSAVAAEAVKIHAVGSGVRENSVVYNADAEPFGLGAKVYIITDAAEYRIDVFIA